MPIRYGLQEDYYYYYAHQHIVIINQAINQAINQSIALQTTGVATLEASARQTAGKAI